MPTFRLPSLDPIWLYAAGAVVVVAILFGAATAIARFRRARRELPLPDPVQLVIPVQRRGFSDIPAMPKLRVSDPFRVEPSRIEGPTRPAGTTPPPTPFPPGIQPETQAQAVASPPEPPHTTNGTGMPSRNGNGGHGPPTPKVIQTVAPTEGTLQFLPGRLEVIDGNVPGRDIRFVRTWGEIPEVTFGRVAGPPYRHIQLRSQTVSRQHARMQYVDARWKLTNLSQTNPVVVNGQALDTAHGQRVLHDGDEIEMGDVLFRFRER